jgi:hypothetical protein
MHLLAVCWNSYAAYDFAGHRSFSTELPIG